MHQKEYIEEMEVVEIDKHNPKDTSVPRELLSHETQQLRRIAWQLNWVLSQRCNSKGPSYGEQIY